MDDDDRTPGARLDLTDHLGLTLARVGTVTRLRLADALAPLQVTMRQFAVLRSLARDEGMSQAELGERLQIDPSSMVLVLDDCQKAGWTERRPHSTDRRRHALHLTPAGRRMLMQAQEAVARAEEGLFAALNADQRARLHELLRALADTGLEVSSPARVSDRAAGGRA